MKKLAQVISLNIDTTTRSSALLPASGYMHGLCVLEIAITPSNVERFYAVEGHRMGALPTIIETKKGRIPPGPYPVSLRYSIASKSVSKACLGMPKMKLAVSAIRSAYRRLRWEIFSLYPLGPYGGLFYRYHRLSLLEQRLTTELTCRSQPHPLLDPSCRASAIVMAIFISRVSDEGKQEADEEEEICFHLDMEGLF